MKILLFSVVIAAISCTRYCEFKNPKKKTLRNNPPGTVHLKGNLYIDRTEVANVHWREYIYWTTQFDSLNLEKALPDTSVWADTLEVAENVLAIQTNAMTDTYFRHPMFNNYPVVGVNYDQAISYCRWRTDRVNEWLAQIPDLKIKKVMYRLPSKQEWETIASDGLDLEKFPWGIKADTTKKNQLPIFCKVYSTNDKAVPPADISSFCPTSIGLYNVNGNVSEMIAAKGIAKGGNWMLPVDSCKVRLDHYYSKPEAWLGFRCVCEVIE